LESEILKALDEDPRLVGYRTICAFLSNQAHKAFLMERGYRCGAEDITEYEKMSVKGKNFPFKDLPVKLQEGNHPRDYLTVSFIWKERNPIQLAPSM